MKRVLKIAGIVIVLLLIVAVGTVAYAFIARQSITDGFEINGIRIVKDGIVSMAVVPIGAGEVALIDAGNDSSGKAILAELTRRGLGPSAVKDILLTHGHPDHTSGILLFPGAQVMALAPEVAMVEGRAGVKVARSLQDGDTVMLGQVPVRVFAVPGHTAGSAAYLVDGVLFMGDSADAAKDGTIKQPPWFFSVSEAQDRASLVRLDQRLIHDGSDVKAIEFAHSGVLLNGLSPLTTFAQQNPQ